jgi:molecular chaperone GrpE
VAEDEKKPNPSAGRAPEESPRPANTGRTAEDEQLLSAHRAAFDQSNGGEQAAEEAACELERFRALLEETKDRALRSQAELENYRKRVARQMEEERRYACLPLLRDLLPVWDNVNRAIEAAEKSNETSGLLEGVKLTAKQLESVLERHECTKIEALHQPFDPHLHEAIAQHPSAELPPNTVMHVAQVGFKLHDRVVRPSQVVISSGVPHPVERDQGADGKG